MNFYYSINSTTDTSNYTDTNIGEIMDSYYINMYPVNKIILTDPVEDGEMSVIIEKDNDKFTMKRKEMYQLIFMLDKHKLTIKSCTFEKFIECLTAVRI